MPKYRVRIRKDTGQWTSIVAIGCDNIGFKPCIDVIRFKRLTSAFNIPPEKIDNSGGQINLLIGLKQQGLQAHRIAKFSSQKHPNVGIYSSPVLMGKYIFVGSDEQSSTQGSISFRTETFDTKLRQFLESEQQVQLNDIRCELCSKTLGCKLCKIRNSPRSLAEQEEQEVIRKSIEIKDDPDRQGKKMFHIEYPEKEGVDLNQLYTERNAN